MNKVLLTVALSAAALVAGAQVVEVQSITKVPASAVAVNIPRISPDGSFAVVSSNTDNSLYRVDLSSGAATRVADNGSALELAFAPDGSAIVYKSAQTQANKLRYYSVESVDLKSGARRQLAKPARHCANYTISPAGMLSINANSKFKASALGTAAKTAAQPIVGIKYGHLELTTADGKTVNLDPQGRGSYLWPQLSPDGTRVVYYLAGKGCFSCRLDGSDIIEYGYLHGAKWLNDNTVVGFQDEDNGTFVTASKIAVINNEGKYQSLTDSSVIAINPSVSADGKTILFSTIEGGLYTINLK